MVKFDLIMLGDHLPDPHTHRYHETQAERHRMWIDLGVHAEELGFDAVWMGEHHASDYIVSSPQMILAAMAMRTRRVRLGTGVSILPNNDPVRRSGSFEPLRDIPVDKRVVLGLIIDQAGYGRNPPMRCSSASTRRAGSFRATSWRFPRNAVSLPPLMATP